MTEKMGAPLKGIAKWMNALKAAAKVIVVVFLAITLWTTSTWVGQHYFEQCGWFVAVCMWTDLFRAVFG